MSVVDLDDNGNEVPGFVSISSNTTRGFSRSMPVFSSFTFTPHARGRGSVPSFTQTRLSTGPPPNVRTHSNQGTHYQYQAPTNNNSDSESASDFQSPPPRRGGRGGRGRGRGGRGRGGRGRGGGARRRRRCDEDSPEGSEAEESEEAAPKIRYPIRDDWADITTYDPEDELEDGEIETCGCPQWYSLVKHFSPEKPLPAEKCPWCCPLNGMTLSEPSFRRLEDRMTVVFNKNENPVAYGTAMAKEFQEVLETEYPDDWVTRIMSPLVIINCTIWHGLTSAHKLISVRITDNWVREGFYTMFGWKRSKKKIWMTSNSIKDHIRLGDSVIRMQAVRSYAGMPVKNQLIPHVLETPSIRFTAAPSAIAGTLAVK